MRDCAILAEVGAGDTAMMRRWLLLALFLLLSLPALAHKASDSYLMLDVKGRRSVRQWDIALRDIDFALGLDADGNGEITWGELRARHADIAPGRSAASRCSAAASAEYQVADHLVDTTPTAPTPCCSLAGECPRRGGELKSTTACCSTSMPAPRPAAPGAGRHLAFRGVRAGAREQRFVAAKSRAWRSSASTWSKASGTSGSASTTSCSCSRCCCRRCWCTRRRRWRGVAASARRAGRGAVGGHRLHRGALDHPVAGRAGPDRAAVALVESAIAASVVLAAPTTSSRWSKAGAGWWPSASA
jgi:hypothetical protein